MRVKVMAGGDDDRDDGRARGVSQCKQLWQPYECCLGATSATTAKTKRKNSHRFDGQWEDSSSRDIFAYAVLRSRDHGGIKRQGAFEAGARLYA